MGTGELDAGSSMGRGMAGGFTPQASSNPAVTRDQEVQKLKSDAKMLAQQLQAIQKKLTNLKRNNKLKNNKFQYCPIFLKI